MKELKETLTDESMTYSARYSDSRYHEEDLNRIRSFRLIDDDFMNACFKDFNEGAELLIRIILGKDDIKVKSVRTQSVMTNLVGRDIRLDIDAEDTDGRIYDIEIQRSDRGAGRKRARYCSSILDANLLKAGKDFEDLPETYVIFITENDVMKKGYPSYRIERWIENAGDPYERFADGEHIIYVNGSYKDDRTALGLLMKDFFCTDPDEMHYEVLAEKVRYIKGDGRGVIDMCRSMEEMRNEVYMIGKLDGRDESRIEVATRLLADGISAEDTSRYSGLEIEKVRELAEEIKK